MDLPHCVEETTRNDWLLIKINDSGPADFTFGSYWEHEKDTEVIDQWQPPFWNPRVEVSETRPPVDESMKDEPSGFNSLQALL